MKKKLCTTAVGTHHIALSSANRNTGIRNTRECVAANAEQSPTPQITFADIGISLWQDRIKFKGKSDVENVNGSVPISATKCTILVL